VSALVDERSKASVVDHVSAKNSRCNRKAQRREGYLLERLPDR